MHIQELADLDLTCRKHEENLTENLTKIVPSKIRAKLSVQKLGVFDKAGNRSTYVSESEFTGLENSTCVPKTMNRYK